MNLLEQEIFQDQYIGMAQVNEILEGVLGYKAKIDLLRQVQDHNKKIYEQEVERSKELLKIAKLRTQMSCSEEKTVFKTSPMVNSKKSFEEETVDISSYYQQIKACKNKDELITVLSKMEQSGDMTLIKSQLLLSCYEEICLMSNFKADLKASYSADDIVFIDQELQDIRKRFEMLKSIINESDKNSTENKEEEKPIILYLKTSSGNACAIKDAESIPREYHESFNELLDSIISGKFKNSKFFSNNGNFLDNMQEVKNFATRIIYKNLQNNIYVIMGMFIKKATSDKYIEAFMKTRSTLYRQEEGNLLNSLTQDETIEREQQITSQIKEIFGHNEKSGEQNATINR